MRSYLKILYDWITTKAKSHSRGPSDTEVPQARCAGQKEESQQRVVPDEVIFPVSSDIAEYLNLFRMRNPHINDGVIVAALLNNAVAVGVSAGMSFDTIHDCVISLYTAHATERTIQ